LLDAHPIFKDLLLADFSLQVEPYVFLGLSVEFGQAAFDVFMPGEGFSAIS